MKVLVADDRPENVLMVRRLLESQGNEVAGAHNGAIALMLARQQDFDLIVSDIMMPEMDGFQLCHAIKTDEHLQKIRFLFYTATYTDEKDEKFALSLGADGFVTKPIEHTEL